jgi:peptide deformylase
MKTIDDLLLLGHPLLYEVAQPVLKSDFLALPEWVSDLDQVMNAIRDKYKFGRGIAAPQIGNMKRLIYIKLDKPLVFINPEIVEKSEEMFEVWDDCMCFPNLLVRVKRHRTIKVSYLDKEGQQREAIFQDDLAELFQHEYDHLEGILCTMRAIDGQAFRWRK